MAENQKRRRPQEKRRRAFPEWQLRPPAGGSKVKVERGDCQNLSVRVSESVILGELRVSEETTIPETPLKRLSLRPKGHLTSVTWVSGPQSAIVQASWSSNQNGKTETRTI